jgi:hypothetical protein
MVKDPGQLGAEAIGQAPELQRVAWRLRAAPYDPHFYADQRQSSSQPWISLVHSKVILLYQLSLQTNGVGGAGIERSTLLPAKVPGEDEHYDLGMCPFAPDGYILVSLNRKPTIPSGCCSH